MKPPRFTYRVPSTVEEAIYLLDQFGDEAKILAGGQSLMPLLNFRLARPSVLIDLNNVQELAYVREEQKTLALGAMTRHRTIERATAILRRCCLFSEAVPLIGHVAVRNRGTVGGSLAHGDPAAEWAAIAVALGGSCEIIGPLGTRTVDAQQFFTGYLTTVLQSSEMLREILLPWPPAGSGTAFMETARRHGDFAVAGVAAVIERSLDGLISNARIAVMSVMPTIIRVQEAEKSLEGSCGSDSDMAEAGAIASKCVDPIGDVYGSRDYKKHLVAVLTERTLKRAAARAGKGGC